MTKIKDLQTYDKNPRKITGKQYDTLRASVEKFGDLSGVVFNKKLGMLVGGNQRTTVYKELGGELEIVKSFNKSTDKGTVAYGFVVVAGERYAYREVEWDKQMHDEANIAANKVGGMFDFDMLANEFEFETLKQWGFEEYELGFINAPTQDNNESLTKTMDSYLEGKIKQVVLFFKKEEFDDVITRLDKVMTTENLQNHTEVFMHILSFYEGNISN